MGGITALFQSMSAFTQGSPFAQNSFDIVAVARRATYAGMADNIETELNSLCSRGFWDAVWQLVLACLTPWWLVHMRRDGREACQHAHIDEEKDED